MTSEYTMNVQNRLTRPLQTIYNLNWKHQSKAKPDGKHYSKGNVSIDFWPTAMDFTIEGNVLQIKWDVVDHKVVNVTFPHPEKLDELEAFLYHYVWG